MIENEDTTEIYINELLKVPPQNAEQDTNWVSKPEGPSHPETYTPIQQPMYTELFELKEFQKLNAQGDETSRKSFITSLMRHSAQNINNKMKEFSLTS